METIEQILANLKKDTHHYDHGMTEEMWMQELPQKSMELRTVCEQAREKLMIDEDGIVGEMLRWDSLTDEEKEKELIHIRKELKRNGWII